MSVIFFFNDTATTEIYTLSLHDALPIFGQSVHALVDEEYSPADLGLEGITVRPAEANLEDVFVTLARDRKSTRLNSSHANISYAVFCLKKKHTSYALSVSHSRLPSLRCR